MQRHCHESRRTKSVRLSPTVEALECRKLLSALGRATLAVRDAGTALVLPAESATLPMPWTGTEVIKAHKVVAFRIPFLVAVNLPPTCDVQQFILETAGSGRHRNADGRQSVPLASATYDQAHRTLTLTPAAPAPVREYSLVTQASFGDPGPPGSQVTWTTRVEPPNYHQSSDNGSSDWINDINPANWALAAVGFR
jgi:hypothetical protein